MITAEDLEAMGYGEYARVRCMTPMAMVKEFAEKTGQEPDTELYEDLIWEEVQEWDIEYPHTTQDLKELADLVYVVYGYANACGYDLDEAVRRVHLNNLERVTQPDGSIKRREDGKILRNPDAPKVNLSDLV
jgi:hypothetical protein